MKIENIIYKSIAQDLKKLIDSHVFKPGEHLPSVRKLSKQWGVSLATVQSAYAELESQGLIRAIPRSGFIVETTPLLPEPKIIQSIHPFEDPGQGHLSTSIVDQLDFDPDFIPLGIATLDPQLFPAVDLHRTLSRISRRSGTQGLAYDFVPGLPKLRRQISQIGVAAGMRIPAEEVVLTNGAIEAFHVSLRAVAKPGDHIVVESPSYYGFLKAIQNMQMHAVEIPTHPKEGIDLAQLSHVLGKKKIAAIMVVSNYSNPLGCTIPGEKKKDLVQLSQKFDVPIIENDIFGELYHSGERPSVCKAYDKKGMVLLCSSFSKTLSPGHRVGWVIPGKFKSRVEWLIHESTFASATLMRLSIAEYLSSCSYQKHLAKLRQHCASQVQQMSSAIAKHFPEGTCLTRPEGGFILWVQLPEKVDGIKLHQAALREKISVTPGSVFSAYGKFRNCIRINCGYALTPQLERAVARLGQLAR